MEPKGYDKKFFRKPWQIMFFFTCMFNDECSTNAFGEFSTEILICRNFHY